MEYLETGKSWRKDPSWPLPETGLKPAGPHWQPVQKEGRPSIFK
jgi:hypothetical protein